MTAPSTPPEPASGASPRGGRVGLAPLPLLTVINFLNYLDRQIVYGMLTVIGPDLGLSKKELGLLGTVNLLVFAVASLVSGPLTDRHGARKVIFTGVTLWTFATIGSAMSGSFATLLLFRALVGVGEGAYGPSSNALLCADAPPDKKGRALGIYNIGMALGGSAGLLLGAILGPRIGWRNALWIAGAPGLIFAVASLYLAVPVRIDRPVKLPARAYLMSPTYLIALAGGVLGTFGASAMITWAETLIIDERHFDRTLAAIYMMGVGIVCGAGGVIAGGYAGDALRRRAPGGHALAVGGSFLLAVVPGVVSLLIGSQMGFMVLCAIAVFFLSVYNGPVAAVVDELAPPQYAATLQGNFLFGIHVLGNATAPVTIGWVADRSSVASALQLAMAAFLASGILFVVVARRQRRAPALPSG